MEIKFKKFFEDVQPVAPAPNMQTNNAVPKQEDDVSAEPVEYTANGRGWPLKQEDIVWLNNFLRSVGVPPKILEVVPKENIHPMDKPIPDDNDTHKITDPRFPTISAYKRAYIYDPQNPAASAMVQNTGQAMNQTMSDIYAKKGMGQGPNVPEPVFRQKNPYNTEQIMLNVYRDIDPQTEKPETFTKLKQKAVDELLRMPDIRNRISNGELLPQYLRIYNVTGSVGIPDANNRIRVGYKAMIPKYDPTSFVIPNRKR